MDEIGSFLHTDRVDSLAEATVEGTQVVSLSHHMDIVDAIEMPDDVKGREFKVFVDSVHLLSFEYKGGRQKFPFPIDCVAFMHNYITLRSDGPIQARLFGRMVSEEQYEPFIGLSYKACDGKIYKNLYNCIALDLV